MYNTCAVSAALDPLTCIYIFQTANINLIFATFVVAFGESFLFGWNIGVLNQPAQVNTIYLYLSSCYANHFTPTQQINNAEV